MQCCFSDASDCFKVVGTGRGRDETGTYRGMHHEKDHSEPLLWPWAVQLHLYRSFHRQWDRNTFLQSLRRPGGTFMKDRRPGRVSHAAEHCSLVLPWSFVSFSHVIGYSKQIFAASRACDFLYTMVKCFQDQVRINGYCVCQICTRFLLSYFSSRTRTSSNVFRFNS